MTKKGLWGQKVALPPPLLHTPSSSRTHRHWKVTFWKVGRVYWRESSKVETIYQEYKFSPFLYRNFPWNPEAIEPEKIWQDNHLFASQRMPQVIQKFHLDKTTYFTASHTDNVIWPTRITENFPVDPSVHQSASWHIPVNKSFKYWVIFIWQRKKLKGDQKTFGQGY